MKDKIKERKLLDLINNRKMREKKKKKKNISNNKNNQKKIFNKNIKHS